MTEPTSESLFARARELFPGGVNSPVRAFRAVGGEPFFVDRGEGARIYDVDGREYIDYVLSWGPLLFGHAHPRVVEAVSEAARRGTSYGAPIAAEVRLAELVQRFFPSMERMRFVNSGTEATMSAVRLARRRGRQVERDSAGAQRHGAARRHADRCFLRLGHRQEADAVGIRHAVLPDLASGRALGHSRGYRGRAGVRHSGEGAAGYRDGGA